MGILPHQERSSWGFIWPFVAHKMSLCVEFFISQSARATQSRELPRDPDAWRLVTWETSEALQKCRFSSLLTRSTQVLFVEAFHISDTASHKKRCRQFCSINDLSFICATVGKFESGVISFLKPETIQQNKCKYNCCANFKVYNGHLY